MTLIRAADVPMGVPIRWTDEFGAVQQGRCFVEPPDVPTSFIGFRCYQESNGYWRWVSPGRLVEVIETPSPSGEEVVA